MPRCDGCGNTRCSCVLVDGDNTEVLGSGSKDDPYRVNVDIGGAGGTRLVGEIIAYSAGVAPTGWLICDGSAVSRSTYAALFAVMGTTYGNGDGTTTFNLPDLAGRFPLGADGSHARGTAAGVETITLGLANIPAHEHAMDHVHSMSHDHGSGFADNQGAHNHSGKGAQVPANTQNANVPSGGGGSHHHGIDQDTGTWNGRVLRGSGSGTDGQITFDGAGLHAHNVSVPAISANTGGSTRNPTSTVGSGSPYTNMPPYSAVTFLVKT